MNRYWFPFATLIAFLSLSQSAQGEFRACPRIRVISELQVQGSENQPAYYNNWLYNGSSRDTHLDSEYGNQRAGAKGSEVSRSGVVTCLYGSREDGYLVSYQGQLPEGLACTPYQDDDVHGFNCNPRSDSPSADLRKRRGAPSQESR